MMLSSAQKTVFQSRPRHPLRRAHTRQPMLRQHLKLTGRQLQMRARHRKSHFCITALQPRTAVELPEGRLYKSTLLVYTVKELREELDRRKADSRGTKVLLVDRLFNLMQEESKQLATAKSDAARAPPHAPQTRAPRRSRRSTDTSAGLQLRRTSQQPDASATDQGSTASQIVQNMQSMPAPHARQAALAVRRTLVNKLALAAKASALKQQQEQQQADEAVLTSAASAWPHQADSPGHSSAQTPTLGPQQSAVSHSSQDSSRQAPLPEGSLSSTGHSSAQQPQPAVEQAAMRSKIDSGSVTRQSSEAGSRSGQRTSQASSSAPGQQAQHAQQFQRAQQARQAQQFQRAQQVQQAGPSSQHAAGIRSSSTPHAVQHQQPSELSNTAAPQQLPGSQPRSNSETDTLAPDSVQRSQGIQSPNTPPQAQQSTDEEDWWEEEEETEEKQEEEDLLKDQQTAAGVESSIQARQTSHDQASTSYNSDTAWKDQRYVEALNNNVTGMQISFLGTGGRQDCRTRSPNCIAVRAQKAVILFDCGEDAQRQLMQQPQLGHSRIHRIFVTVNDCQHIYGLPGMLCTLSWARERGFEDADIPIHVYGPPGLAEYVRSMLLLSDTYSMVPILIHEFSFKACDPEPEQILERGRLYRVRLPPDQLNPEGYYDGTLKKAFLSRYSKKKKTGRDDLRAQTKKMKLPEPGDPSLTDLHKADLTWTISCDEDFAVTAFWPLYSWSPNCWGYSLQEADRAGTLDPARAQALGVPPGRAYGQLKAGESILNSDGEVVLPEQVLGPDQLGRKIVILPPVMDIGFRPLYDGAHTIVAAVADPSNKHPTRHLGKFANVIGAKQLILTNLNDNEEQTEACVRQAADGDGGVYPDKCNALVHAAYDHLVSVLDKPKG